MRELHLFAGIGGGVLGGMMLGHRPVGLVEKNDYCREILAKRFPGVPIHDDITTYQGRRGSADVVAGGFPCQDISAAGKGRGLKGSRSGLWFEMLRVVSEVEPAYVFLENSPLLRSRGLGTVLRGLAVLGFDAEWSVFSAASVGAVHLRKRLWLLGAHPDRARLLELGAASDAREGRQDEAGHDAHGLRANVPNPLCEGLPQWSRAEAERPQPSAPGSGWWASEPGVCRVADGFPSRVDRIRALGNAQVPLCAATAFRMLHERFTS